MGTLLQNHYDYEAIPAFGKKKSDRSQTTSLSESGAGYKVKGIKYEKKN